MVAFGLLALLLIAVLLQFTIDSLLLRRFPALAERPLLVALLRWPRALLVALYPERLVAPVQLTLSTNLRLVLFVVALAAGVVALGATYARSHRPFGPFADEADAEPAPPFRIPFVYAPDPS